MPKNIVICCDGTSNDVTSDSTNVLRLFRSLQRNDRQVCYYDSGVGTLADPTKLTTLGRRLSKKVDMAIGQSVRSNVCDAYQFLSCTFEPGDLIFLFGFSRGAYTVRALAGMIHFLGLVPSELAGLAQLAWTIYADDDESLPTSKRFESGKRFKKAFPVGDPVRIHFVGGWDTVSTFGWIWNLRTAPHTANNPSIDHIRHAVAIDERRSSFQANLFRPKTSTKHASFREVWFPGAHADIGGGYPENESGLAKISFRWMCEEARQCGCLLDEDQLQIFLGDAPNSKGKLLSKPNVMAATHNSTGGYWHLLEWMPRKQWDHRAQPERLRWFAPNLYRSRKVPDDAEFHESVQQKWNQDHTYRPSNIRKWFQNGSPPPSP